MLSNILDKISFWALFLVVVLLPVFFLPFTQIPVETSKGLLLVVGLVVSIIFWAAARFSDGKVVVPRSWTLVAGLGVVFAFLLSAFFSGASSTSYFGIMLDIGTFWFVFSGFLLMLVSSVVLRDKENARKVMLGLLLSFGIVFIFQMLRIAFPQTLSLGVLGAKTDNLAGSWNTFGLLAGLSVVISLFVTEFFSISKKLRRILVGSAIFSIAIIILVNFMLVWKLLGIFSLLIFVYKISSYARGDGANERKFPVFPFTVIIISLLFFISGQFIGGYLPSRLGLTNLEVSPSMSSTMAVTKESLRNNPVLGVGPNKFQEAWSMYKPASINSSEFWNTSFVSGSGLLPTFVSTTGILGTLALLMFLLALFIHGGKVLFRDISKRENFETSAFFIAALYLLAASFFYATGVVIFLLFFVFVGIFVGLSSNREHGAIEMSFLDDPRKSFFSILALVIVMIASAGLSFKYIQRFASVQYFGNTLQAQDPDEATRAIQKALALHTNDLYLRTYAQLYLSKINVLVNKSKTAELTEADKAELQANFDESIQAATLAVAYNPKNYLNWEMQGTVYHSVSVLGLVKAYDKAIESYNSASQLNPLNPGLKLAIANAYNAQGLTKEAKAAVAEALVLKPDYLDALLTMSQLEKNLGNNSSALSYAQAALKLAPTNKELVTYVNSFKDTPAPTSEPETSDSEGN